MGLRLPEKAINEIKHIIEIAPRTGLELLLVSAGVKTGDIVHYYDCHIIGEEVIKAINELKSNGVAINYYINEKVSGFHDIIYFKKSIDEGLLEDVKEALSKGLGSNEVMGAFYGYPDCCIKNYNPKGQNHAFTEHKWCKPDCEKSIQLGRLFHEVVMINLPEYEYLIRRFNYLRNGVPELTLVWNEMLGKDLRKPVN